MGRNVVIDFPLMSLIILRVADHIEFAKIMQKNLDDRKTAFSKFTIERVALHAVCISFAIALNRNTDIMLCTGYNLAICMRICEISPGPEAAAQLLMWIQDGLDHLKNMPPAPEDVKLSIGEVILFDHGEKIGSVGGVGVNDSGIWLLHQ